jgi:hypothetical protein
MTIEQPRLAKTEEKDLGAIADFIRRENNDSHISEEYLNWWYFQNPSNSFSLWHYLFENKIVGMATTNNFHLQTASGKQTAAMPQKVLTSASMRGKGLFGKLYWQTEKDNLANNVNCFLTITNEMSTPIFLEKFGYLRGLCPDVITILPSPASFIKTKNYVLVKADSIKDSQEPQNNAFIKTAEHFLWRYSSASEEKCVTLKIKGNNGAIAGFVFLKKIYKKRLPLYILLDLLILQESEVERLLAEAVKYATRKFSLGLLALDHEKLSSHWQKFVHRRVENRFNFLAKGRNNEETKQLSKTKFNFTFGDLDFI